MFLAKEFFNKSSLAASSNGTERFSKYAIFFLINGGAH